MSLVHMPFPVSWFHSLSPLLSVLLKQIPSKGNFWQKSWACILCSSALHYVGTSRQESPTRSPSQVQLWLLQGVPMVSGGRTLLSGAREAGQPWHGLLLTALSSNAALPSCRQCLPSAGFSDEGKESQIEKKKKKKRDCFSVFYLARLYHYIMQVHFKHYRSSGG